MFDGGRLEPVDDPKDFVLPQLEPCPVVERMHGEGRFGVIEIVRPDRAQGPKDSEIRSSLPSPPPRSQRQKYRHYLWIGGPNTCQPSKPNKMNSRMMFTPAP